MRGSFIPERPQRELRELVRYRRSIIRQCSQVVNRIQKVLEGANIELSSVASNVTGASGRAMLEAISQGVEDPKRLAGFAKGRLREKKQELEKVLQGLVGPQFTPNFMPSISFIICLYVIVFILFFIYHDRSTMTLHQYHDLW